jgi:hypothetical protein
MEHQSIFAAFRTSPSPLDVVGHPAPVLDSRYQLELGLGGHGG